MQRIAMILMLVGWLIVQVGCGGSEEPAVETIEDAAEEAPLPEEVSPLELMQDKPEEPDAPEAVEEQAAVDEPAAPVEPAKAVELVFHVPADNVAHRIAERSAFPEEGETFEEPIAAKRLTDEDTFAVAVDEEEIPDVVPWAEAKKYLGQEITVEGKIVDVGEINEGTVNFLNFHQDWRDKFYLVVFGDLAKTLDKSVSQTFLNKTVRVTGEVEDHRGRPQIKILSMDQVEFVD